ncbi:SDR family oxidoreductase [Botrimarina sp.]|uniref:SDR family oxidoreductase n=1 Tax=Botrimarina sp. TaxID=2795802 RepID=UPI0032EFBE0F
MSDRLQGKRALLTAAGQGIGRATALAFAREGASVVATDIDAGALESLAAAAPGVQTAVLDARDASAIERVAADSGPLDVLFSCAGFVHHGTILDCGEEDWSFSFDLNVTSAYRLTKAVLPGMLQRGGGSLVYVASVASSVRGVPNRFVYGATKAAVIGLTKAVAADFVGKGIRANAICPGTVESPSLQRRIKAQGGDYDAVRQSFIDRQPMGRLGTPEEIAELAVYLASDESAYTTGAIHVIDGGWCM